MINSLEYPFFAIYYMQQLLTSHVPVLQPTSVNKSVRRLLGHRTKTAPTWFSAPLLHY